MRILILCLTVASFGVSAQSVYKCVGKGGVDSFQSEPCSSSDEVKKVWDATPQRLSNEEQWRLYRARQKAANDAAYLRNLAGRGAGAQGTVVKMATNRCANAKRERDNYSASHPKRTSKDMSRWAAYVYEACK